MKDKYVKRIRDSIDSYARLKLITDAAQAGTLSPWGKPVIDLLNKYDISVDRLKDVKVQVNLSFPTSTTGKSMAVGFRYQKTDGSFAEDLFLFEENVGLTCYYKGSQEKHLPEYADSHHAKIILSEFLPDMKQELEKMKQEIGNITKQRPTPGVDIVTEAEFEQAIKQIDDDFREQVRSFTNAHGNSSAPQAFSMAAQKEATKKRVILKAKKEASDRQYELEKQDIFDEYEEKYSMKESELASRNMLNSGFGQQDLLKIKEQERRAIEKLNLKYGKNRES